MNPLVSVIIPTYNREATIEAAVRSVLKQTYSNIEVIVVDDCSNDSTETIIKKIDDRRLRYYRLAQNRRACFARNYGFLQSSGTLVALHDSDDLWHSDKLEKQIAFMNSENYDFVFCGMNRIMPDGNIFYYPEIEIDNNIDFYHQELCENVVSTQTMLMKRIVFENIRFDETFKRYQDWDFSIRVSKCYKVGYLKEALVDSYLQSNSVTVTIPGYEALLHLYKKYEIEIERDKLANYSIQVLLGDSIRGSDPRIAKRHFLKALRIKFDLKILLKCFLSIFGIKY